MQIAPSASGLSSGVANGDGGKNNDVRALVLCDATNETSVRDMPCRDNKEVCKHCSQKTYSTGDTWRSQKEAEPGESPYSCQSFA
jgi:hypothetical protein